MTQEKSDFKLGAEFMMAKDRQDCIVPNCFSRKPTRHHLMCKRHWLALELDWRKEVLTQKSIGVARKEYFATVAQAVKSLM